LSTHYREPLEIKLDDFVLLSVSTLTANKDIDIRIRASLTLK